MTNPAITQGAIANQYPAADAPAKWSLLQLLRNWNVRRKIKALHLD